MSNPDYPEGVTERDIDRIGEPIPLTEEFYDKCNHENQSYLCEICCHEKISALESQLKTVTEEREKGE